MQGKIEIDGGKHTKQKVILGTHTSDGDQNHLILGEVTLPTQESETDASGYDEEAGEVGGYGASSGRFQVRHELQPAILLLVVHSFYVWLHILRLQKH